MKPIFYLFMNGVFFEIFYNIVKLNKDFIPIKPILFVCIKLCIYAYTVVNILKYCTHHQFYI